MLLESIYILRLAKKISRGVFSKKVKKIWMINARGVELWEMATKNLWLKPNEIGPLGASTGMINAPSVSDNIFAGQYPSTDGNQGCSVARSLAEGLRGGPETQSSHLLTASVTHRNEPMPMNRIELLEALRKMHPEIQWGEWPLGDYEQCAELDAPDILVCFGSEKEGIEEGLADAFSTMLGERCEPSHWGISVQAAEMVTAHNRVTVHKYPNNDGPRQKLS